MTVWLNKISFICTSLFQASKCHFQQMRFWSDGTYINCWHVIVWNDLKSLRLLSISFGEKKKKIVGNDVATGTVSSIEPKSKPIKFGTDATDCDNGTYGYRIQICYYRLITFFLPKKIVVSGSVICTHLLKVLSYYSIWSCPI
jgi:hypothetical protein